MREGARATCKQEVISHFQSPVYIKLLTLISSLTYPFISFTRFVYQNGIMNALKKKMQKHICSFWGKEKVPSSAIFPSTKFFYFHLKDYSPIYSSESSCIRKIIMFKRWIEVTAIASEFRGMQ